MSVSVNQSEKFLSLDKPVTKTSSTVRADSPVDSQERQTFRATFEEQRALENRNKNRAAKVDAQNGPKNKGEIAETKRDKPAGSVGEHKHIEGERNSDRLENAKPGGLVGEVDRSEKSESDSEKTGLAGQNKEQSSLLDQNPGSPPEQSNELVSEVSVTTKESFGGEAFVNIDKALLSVNGAVDSKETTLPKTAEAAVIAVKGGNTLPVEGESVISNEVKSSFVALGSALQDGEKNQGEKSQVQTQGQVLGQRDLGVEKGVEKGIEKGIDKSVAEKVEAPTGKKLEATSRENSETLMAKQVQNSTPSQNIADPLAKQVKNTSSVMQNVSSTVAPEGNAAATSETSSAIENLGSGKIETAAASNQKALMPETKVETTPALNTAPYPDFKEPANIVNGDKANNSELTPTLQGARPESQQETANIIANAEVKSAVEQAFTAQTQKVSDGNIHSQSTATVDKNLNIENKAQYLNAKTEATHFVNTQHTSSAVNANVPVDGSTASSRQSYTPDTGQVLDAQIKDVEKLSVSQGSEQDDSTEVTATNKNPIHGARWTQSIEQFQTLGKSTSLQTTIPSKFGGDQWANAVADKVMWLSSQRIQSAEIKLDPPELGPMQVRVSVQQDQASVSFVSHHQSVREALDQNVFKLREQFGNEGLDLVDVSVSDHPSQQSMSNGGDSGFHGDDPTASSTDNELTQETEVMELLNLVDHYV